MSAALPAAALILEGIEEWLDMPSHDDRPALERGAEALQSAGVSLGDAHWWEPAGAVLITEAINLAGKALSWDFYQLKPACVRETAALLAREGRGGFGWGQDGCFYLHHPTTGTACFHDPFNEIGLNDWRWHAPWSGITRQEWAFELLGNRRLRLQMAWATCPERGAQVRTWLWQPGPVGKLP